MVNASNVNCFVAVSWTIAGKKVDCFETWVIFKPGVSWPSLLPNGEPICLVILLKSTAIWTFTNESFGK